jgi:hypothetical protein
MWVEHQMNTGCLLEPALIRIQITKYARQCVVILALYEVGLLLSTVSSPGSCDGKDVASVAITYAVH